jgi:hypothetical protein
MEKICCHPQSVTCVVGTGLKETFEKGPQPSQSEPMTLPVVQIWFVGGSSIMIFYSTIQ